MILITIGSLEERIIKLLQETYPITTSEIAQKLKASLREIERVLKKFQIKRIVQLEPFPDKTYVRLLRDDFQFVGSKQQRKTIKHTTGHKKEEIKNYDDINDIMYS